MEEVYVTQAHHMRNTAKLEWLRLELSGESAYLNACAAKFKQLSSTLSIKEQRRLCLELYRDYARTGEANITGEYKSVEDGRRKAYNNGVHIPACEIQGFEKVWNPDAPARCHGCKAPMPEECTNTKCKTCAAAAKKKYNTTCIQAAHGGERGGDVAVVNGCFVCKKCGHWGGIHK